MPDYDRPIYPRFSRSAKECSGSPEQINEACRRKHCRSRRKTQQRDNHKLINLALGSLSKAGHLNGLSGVGYGKGGSALCLVFLLTRIFTQEKLLLVIWQDEQEGPHSVSLNNEYNENMAGVAEEIVEMARKGDFISALQISWLRTSSKKGGHCLNR